MYLYKDMSFILSHMHQSHRYNSPNGVSGKNEPTMLFVFWAHKDYQKLARGVVCWKTDGDSIGPPA